MTNTSFTALLDKLGILPEPRYSLDAAAAILGLTPAQIRAQIKKRHLCAVRGSRRRWTGVMHEDLDAYFTANNAQGGE